MFSARRQPNPSDRDIRRARIAYQTGRVFSSVPRQQLLQRSDLHADREDVHRLPELVQ
jgi:hypothetical protein